MSALVKTQNSKLHMAKSGSKARGVGQLAVLASTGSSNGLPLP